MVQGELLGVLEGYPSLSRTMFQHRFTSACAFFRAIFRWPWAIPCQGRVKVKRSKLSKKKDFLGLFIV